MGDSTNWPVEIDPVFGCRLWTSKLDRDGYGVSYRGSSSKRAHVRVYEEEVGAVPEGKVLDHVCRRRNCVATHHLEPVTKSENELRKSWRYRLRRTHCAKGHDMKLTAVVTPEGGRICRTCNQEARQ